MNNMPFAKTYFISGHSRLPDGMAAKTLYNSMTITAEIEAKYGVIIAVSCTLANENARTYIENLLKGFSLNDGIEVPIQLMQHHIKGRAINSIIGSFKDLYKQYNELKAEIKDNVRLVASE